MTNSTPLGVAPGALFNPREFLGELEFALFEFSESCFPPRDALGDVLDRLIEKVLEVQGVGLDHGVQMLRETSLARGVEAGLRNLEVLPRLLVVRVRHVRIQQDLQLIQEGQPILEHRRQIGCRGHRAADRRSSA